MSNMQKAVGSLGGVAGRLCVVVIAVQAMSCSVGPQPSAVDRAGDSTQTTQSSSDQTLDGAGRFVLVLPTTGNPAGEGALDKKTGLMWEQSPLTTFHRWAVAGSQCTNRTVGGQKDWRLPSVYELMSVVVLDDPIGDPDLPTGHPFNNIQSSGYWTSTVDTKTPRNVWIVDLINSDVFTTPKRTSNFIWCVRGHMKKKASAH